MAKMTFKVTRKDKILMYVLCFAVIIFIFFRFVFTPISEDINDLEIQVEAAENDMFEMQSLISRRDALIAENDKLLAEKAEIDDGFYAKMENYEIDKMITYMIMDYGLEMTDFRISEKAVNALLSPYMYSGAAADSASDVNVSTDILSSSISLKVTGERQKIITLIDHITNDLSSMRIISYGFSDITVDAGYDKNGAKITQKTTQLTAALEIYMY